MDQHVQRSTVNFTRFAESHLRVPFPVENSHLLLAVVG